MQLPQSVMALPGTKLGYAVAAVMLIILVILLVAVWRNATFGGAAAAIGGAVFGGAAFGLGGDNFDTEYNGDYGGYGGGARPVRIMMRPAAFAALHSKKSGIAARIKRGPFTDLSAGTDVEVRRSRPPGDSTEYGDPRAVAAHVTSVEEYGSYAELVKAVGAAAFGSKSESAAVAELSEFGAPGAGEKVVAIHLRVDKAIERHAKPGVAASANRYHAKHATKHGSGMDDDDYDI